MVKKKSEIYSSLWESCDKLRGGMDASQYKDYILILLFVKYISDKCKADSTCLIKIPEGASFDDMAKLKGDKEIGDKINIIIRKIAQKNELTGVIDVADFNDDTKLGKGKEMVDRLTALIGIFQREELDFSKNRAGGDDILGDAYEYLMKNFATESGKSKGQFYTPAEVSRIMAKVIGVSESKSQEETLYDPTCGSGSLLLKAADEAPHGISIYGQEMDNATTALAKMNMILHNHETAEIHQDNTLSSPQWKDGIELKTFNYAVSNPPFSSKAWTTGLVPDKDIYKRFDGYGVPPEKNGDYAFLLHLIKSLKSNGKGAIILPHGVLFRGNVEAEIRKSLIRKRYIKGIIALPPNLFFGTGIPACIIIIDKENAETRKGLFMIDAGKGFVKDGNKNRLREQDIRKIVDVFNGQIEIDKYSRMVGFEEIEQKNNYNLNIPRYIDSQEPEDIHDICAHIQGGIPELDVKNLHDYWEVYPSMEKNVFEPERPGYFKLKIEKDLIKPTILDNAEFQSFARNFETNFTTWQTKIIDKLRILEIGFKPKQLIQNLADDILKTFEGISLIDKYDIYQHLMNYWNETLQDDTYIISRIGWMAELREIEEKKNNRQVITYVCDLIPAEILINRYFKSDQEAIDSLESHLESLKSEKEEIIEENSGEEGYFEELKNDKGSIPKKTVEDRYKAIKNDKNNKEEANILKRYLDILADENKTTKEIKDAQEALYKKGLKKYKELTVDEIKALVIEDKWMTTLSTNIHSEIDNISQTLSQRIKTLAERYYLPLPIIEKDIEELSKKVNGHLEKMGVVCGVPV